MQELATEIARRKHGSDDWIDELIDIVMVLADEMRDAITDKIQNLYREQYYGVLYSNGADAFVTPDEWNGLHDKLSGKDCYERLDELLNPATLPLMDDRELADISRQLGELIGNEGERAVNAARQQAGTDAENEADVLATKTWNAMLDERTRATHWLLHGTTVGINDWFRTVNGRTQRPGEFHIPEEDVNCRCRLVIQIHGEYPRVEANSYDAWLDAVDI